MKISTKICITIFTGVALASTAGCLNIPTKPAKIEPSYVSSLRYKNYTCQELKTEKTALSNQENKLVYAQNQRIDNSRVQALAFGFGQGDGIAAPEIANVKGKLSAINTTLKNKRCG